MKGLERARERRFTAIRVKGLCCGYGRMPVLDGIMFSIQRGEFVGVLGPNGAGKSMLLMALGGILPIRYGRIEIEGNDFERLRIKERGRLMAVVIQDAEVRLRFLCGEVVRMGRYAHQKRW